MLRVTVREDFSYELASDLINDLKTVIEWLDHHFIYSGRQSTCSSEPCSHAPTIPPTHVTVARCLLKKCRKGNASDSGPSRHIPCRALPACNG